MEPESIELGFLSVFALITFFIFLILEIYSKKTKEGILIDEDFSKPQAFHEKPISRIGGVGCFVSLMIFIWIYYLLYNEILYEYIFIGLSLFLIGYLDDLKFKLSPNLRLIFMIIFLLFFINYFSVEVQNLDIFFLKFWLENKILSNIFVLICFLFVVNGANLIDGFNGLLCINLIIVNSVLLFLNLNGNHLEFAFFLTGQIIILVAFLLFNFPKAKIFLGDSGSYLLGSIVALNVIFTNNLNPQISSFFFCILLFYLFFEVFFSFIRKIYQKKSPVQPDDIHLHMLSFKKIDNGLESEKANYLNSTLINLIYSALVLPSIYFADNSLVCKYWFFALMLIYTMFYIRLYRLKIKSV
mgnify:CR=1 FL=1